MVAGWIADTRAERDNALARIAATTQQPDDQLTIDDIATIPSERGDIVAALAEAEPEQKGDLYRDLGLRLTYRPDTKTVQVKVDLDRNRWDLVVSKASLPPYARIDASTHRRVDAWTRGRVDDVARARGTVAVEILEQRFVKRRMSSMPSRGSG